MQTKNRKNISIVLLTLKDRKIFAFYILQSYNKNIIKIALYFTQQMSKFLITFQKQKIEKILKILKK
jgi:hypothetical protein